MGFATRTLRDTVVNAAGAGGTVTIPPALGALTTVSLNVVVTNDII